jgi:hypothetical protein
VNLSKGIQTRLRSLLQAQVIRLKEISCKYMPEEKISCGIRASIRSASRSTYAYADCQKTRMFKVTTTELNAEFIREFTIANQVEVQKAFEGISYPATGITG